MTREGCSVSKDQDIDSDGSFLIVELSNLCAVILGCSAGATNHKQEVSVFLQRLLGMPVRKWKLLGRITQITKLRVDQ